MGTKMHFESYLPGYYSMRNLCEDSNGGSWPIYSGDKNLANGQYYNGFLSKGGGVGGYSAYEKDVLKQKMLEHDAIFRSQVYELHRLYKIQRDLIDEIRRKELQTYHVPSEASVYSSPFGFQLPEEIQKWHNPGFPLVNSIRPLVSGAENSQSHLSSIENKSSHVGLGDSQNGGKSMDCEILGSRPTKVRRKMFDLQLPADHYNDTEEVEQSGNKTVADSDDVKVFNASLRGEIGLADLNEPFKVEEANTSGSLDIQANGSLKFLPNCTSQKLNLGRDIVTSNNTQIENKGSGREWMSYMFEAGRPKHDLRSDNQGFKLEKFPVNSQPLQGMLNKVHDFQTLYPTDPNKEGFWRERTIPASRFSERNNDRSQGYQYGSSYDPNKSYSHSIPMWDNSISNINQPAMLVESRPGFSLSARSSSSHSSVQNHGLFGEKVHFNGNTSSNSGFRKDVLNRNGFYQGSSSGSRGHLTSTGFDNLNHSNGCNNVADELIKRSSTHHFDASNHVDLNSSNHIKLDLILSRSSNQLSNKIESGNGQGKSFTQIITSASCSGYVQSNGVDVGERPTSKSNIGFPIFGKFDNSMNKSAAVNSPSVICPSKGETFDDTHKNVLLDINCPYDPAVSETDNDKIGNFVEKRGEKEVDSSKHFIDLNSCISDDDEALLTTCKSYSSTKKIEIDLEAPLAPESQEGILGKESPQDLHVTSMQSSKQKADCTQDERMTLAAEAIVAMSSFECSNQSEKETSNPLDEGLTDPLRWFVDVISSCMNDHEVGKHGDCKNESSSNGLDYFESMTLKLTEEKIDEYYLSEFCVKQNPKDEETGNNLLTNRRKGQARRGRQKRDFQRDILPVIASLSRHEVREDLHTFEGLVKATTGVTWHSSLTRRGAAKSGYGRGRRRSTATTVIIPSQPSHVCSVVIPKVNNINMCLEDRSLTGWGKTTRRPRRQRGPAGNPPPPIRLT